MKKYISINEIESIAIICTHLIREMNPNSEFVKNIDNFVMHIKNWQEVNKEYNEIEKIRECYSLLQNNELSEDDFFIFFEKYVLESEVKNEK